MSPALDFPSNPTDGQIFGNYYWSASYNAWRASTANTNLGTRVGALETFDTNTVGLKGIVPTNITPVTGTATYTSTGKVTVSGVTAVIIDGIFTSKYKNYKIKFRPTTAGGTNTGVRYRMVTNGTEHAAGNWFGGGWYSRYNGATGATSVSGETSAFISWLTSYATSSTGTDTDFYSPSDSSMYTLCNTFSGGNDSGGISTIITSMLFQEAVAHTGVKIFLNTGTTFSGDIFVYGYNE